MSKLKTYNEMINDIIQHIKEYSIHSERTYHNHTFFTFNK